MSIETLKPLLKPNSVALMGASSRTNSIGSVVIKNLLQAVNRHFSIGSYMMLILYKKAIFGLTIKTILISHQMII